MYRPLFMYKGASLRLTPMSEDVYALSSLISLDRGKGHATAVMERVAEYADDKNITLRLVVQRFGKPRDGLDNRQLQAFYECFGFVVEGDQRPPFHMVRVPSR